MIICPQCQHHEMDGAIFCSECGAQLIGAAPADTHRIEAVSADKGQRPTAPTPAPAAALPKAWISLHILDSGYILPLADRTEFTLGRVVDGQPIMPDVDLTPHNAYACGVSRLHAVLKLAGDKIVVMDLDSSNGTYVNGVRIPPQVETPLVHGDVITLGKLKIQVLFSRAHP